MKHAASQDLYTGIFQVIVPVEMKICIPIREKMLQKAQQQVRKAAKHANFIEIWLDFFPAENLELNLKKLIKMAQKPVIAVCRANDEKGSFSGTEEQRIERLALAMQAGAKLVDIGLHTNKSLIRFLKKSCRRKGAKMIISQHIWDQTPRLSYLLSHIQKAKKLGADIVKIATQVRSWSDNTVLFELTARAQEIGQKVIIIGMGEKGKISRIGSPLLGSFLTYAALDEKSKTAPGQPTIDELRKLKLF